MAATVVTLKLADLAEVQAMAEENVRLRALVAAVLAREATRDAVIDVVSEIANHEGHPLCNRCEVGQVIDRPLEDLESKLMLAYNGTSADPAPLTEAIRELMKAAEAIARLFEGQLVWVDEFGSVRERVIAALASPALAALRGRS